MKLKILALLVAVVVLAGCAPLGPTGYPAVGVQENTAYLANGNGIFAVDVRNGVQVWRFPEKTTNGKVFFQAPTVFNDVVVAGDYAGVLHGLSTQTGVEQWTFTEAKGRYIGQALVVGDLLIVPNGDYSLYALDKDGRKVWSYATGQSLWAAPVSDGNLVFQASLDHYLYAIEVTTGELVWKVDLGGALISAPALDTAGNLYIGSLANQISAVRAVDGKMLWQVETDGAVWATPTLIGETLVVGDQKGNVYSKQTADGAPAWMVNAGTAVIGSGVVLGDNILIGTDDGNLQALTADGKVAWTRAITGRLLSHLTATSDVALVGVLSGDSSLLAYTPTGETTWSFVAPK